MLENYFLKGLFIAIVFGIPIGVVGVITVQRTLSKGFIAGVISGFGSSCADTIYAIISVFGVTLISDFLLTYQSWICMIGCLIIIITGFHIVKKESNMQLEEVKESNRSTSFFTSFLITLTNPAAIVSFIFIFPTFGVSGEAMIVDKVLLIIGIFVGTGLWWIVLAGAVKYSKKFITERIFTTVNKVFGMLIIGLGIGVGIYTMI